MDKFVKKNRKALNEMRGNLYKKGIRWNKASAEMKQVAPTTQPMPTNANPVMMTNEKKEGLKSIHPAIWGGIVLGMGAVGYALYTYLNPSATGDFQFDTSGKIDVPQTTTVTESTGSGGGSAEQQEIIDIIVTDNQGGQSGSSIRDLLEGVGVAVTDTLEDVQLGAVFSSDSLSDEAKLQFATLEEGEYVIDEYTDFRIINNLFGE